MTHTRVPKWARGVTSIRGPVSESLPNRLSVCGSNTCMSAACLCLSGVFLFTLCVWFVLHPLAPSRNVFHFDVGDHRSAFCFDVHRASHYPTVHINMGTPMRTYNVLLRLDTVVNSSNTLVIHNSVALLSSTVDCNETTNGIHSCTDRAIFTSSHTDRARISSTIRYAYGDRFLVDQQSIKMALDGELLLCSTCLHFLLSREYCIVTNAGDVPSSQGLGLQVGSNGRLSTSVGLLRAAGTPWTTNYATASDCDVTEQVRFIPADTYTEASSLLFETSAVQELAGSVVVKGMRNAMEAGSACATTQPHLKQYASRYFTRCVGLVSDSSRCMAPPVFTFHRVAAHRLVVQCSVANCTAYASADLSLASLPDRDDHESEIHLSILRLLLMLLAAVIVWIRSENAEASVDHLFQQMIKYSVGGEDAEGHPITINKFSVMLSSRDVILGGLACFSRLVAIAARHDDFHADGQSRVFVIESVAASLSILHWLAHATDYLLMRLNVWDARAQEHIGETHLCTIGHKFVKYFACNIWRGDAFATLGGSAAIVDVSCATIIAFTDTPLRSGSHNFDAVARLLTAILIALTGICRCLFSLSITGVLAQHDNSGAGRCTAVGAAIYWLIQSAAVASAMCYLFVVPLATHITRRTPGGSAWVALSVLAFLSTLAGPRITANLMGVLRLQ